MKFRCQICNEFVEAENVITHDATHVNARFEDVLKRFHALSTHDRVRLIELYCDVCGWRLVDGRCERVGCDFNEDESERPQGGGGPDQSPLETAPTPVGVRPLTEPKP